MRKVKSLQKDPNAVYEPPGVLYLVRWLEPPRLWKQCIESDKEAALEKIATIQREQGKPGSPYEKARFFSVYFTDLDGIPGRRGPPVGRYLIKWKYKGGVRMEVAYTWEDAVAAHRKVWQKHHLSKGFWLNPNIHERLS